jgi:hypothetical protein
MLCVPDFIKNISGVLDTMISKKTSLQNTLNGLMKTGSADEYFTRMWSTCSSMLKINGVNDKDEDELMYTIDDSTTPLPLPSVLQCIQQSSNQLLKVTIADQKGVKASFEDLYAHFLIELHTHTTHYVRISQEFPLDKDFNTQLNCVSSKCKSAVKTKTIVMVELDSTEKKDEGQENFKKLLERLLKDGVNTVVVLTQPDDTRALLNLFIEVKQKVKEVIFHPLASG